MQKLVGVICFMAVPGYVVSWNDVRIAMWDSDPASVVLMAFASIAIIWLFCSNGFRWFQE